MKKSDSLIRVLTEIAIFAALGFAMSVLEGGIWKGLFANGGSIGFAMIPVFIIAYRRGLLPGLTCGIILSVIKMLSGVYVIQGANFSGIMAIFAPIIQVFLDYVVGYTVIGFAGAFARQYHEAQSLKEKNVAIICGCVLGGLLKYASHVLAGGFFWLDPSITFLGVNGGSWWYSFFYNGLCCIPSTILCTALMLVIAKVYPQFLTANEGVKESIEEEEDTHAEE